MFIWRWRQVFFLQGELITQVTDSRGDELDETPCKTCRKTFQSLLMR